MQFVVIVPMYNMAPWIARNIGILKEQTCRNFRCLIGDDLSTDNSAHIAREAIGGDERFELVRHSAKKYSMGNIHALIEHARPADEDVVVLVDGDDRLAHEKVLERLHRIYSAHGCWMTYGSFASERVPLDPICSPYPRWAVRWNRFRNVKWRASHLKTFKYGLWKHVPPSFFTITPAELQAAVRRRALTLRWKSWRRWRNVRLEDLLDPAGRFPRRCSDKTLTMPMLELAGRRSLFVDEVLYVYTTYEKDLDFGKKHMHQKWYTRLIRDILEHKPRLKPLARLNGGREKL